MNGKTSGLSYSEIVYLFADQLISSRAKLINYDLHPSDEKIPVKELAQKMVTAALLYLRDNSQVEIRVVEKKEAFNSVRT